MRETEIYGYYSFGYNYCLLRYESKDSPVHGGTESLISRINDFFEFLELLDLRVTMRAADELIDLRGKLKKEPQNAKVDTKLAAKVQEIIGKIDSTLDAELKLSSAFMVTPKRYPLDNLLKSPKDLFAAHVFDNLPALSRFDFQEAGRCIAFGVSTAGGFHIMRGMEGVLRHYYCSIIKRGRIAKPMWNDMIRHLRSRRDAPPRALLDNLDNIRINFRNPTQHPEARYDMDEAQDLLSLSIDAINRINKDLLKRSR